VQFYSSSQSHIKRPAKYIRTPGAHRPAIPLIPSVLLACQPLVSRLSANQQAVFFSCTESAPTISQSAIFFSHSNSAPTASRTE